MAIKSLPEKVPFPNGLRTIELPEISLKGLLDNDKTEIDKIWEICKSTGFFYLNLTDHPTGIKLWNQGVEACEVGHTTLPNVSMKEKLAYKARERIGVFDMGYKCPSAGANGEPKFSEAFNVPFYELAVDKTSNFELPPWLRDHRDLFISLMENGNEVSDILLGVLEQRLQVQKGALTSLHTLEDPSNDFLRVLRYPGTPMDVEVSQTNFPPHRDSVSIAMLFTWVGGLQILDPAVEKARAANANASNGSSGHTAPTNGHRNGVTNGATNGQADDGWRWIKPLPGHVIVNLGDALAILTNDLLKSGFHRVITGPGAQKTVDKYSVLLGYRPALTTKMTPLESPVITPLTQEQQKEPILTCEEWGAQRVQKVYQVLENR